MVENRWWPRGLRLSETSVDGRCCAHCGAPSILLLCDHCYNAGIRSLQKLPSYRKYMAEHTYRLRSLIESRGW